MAHDNFEYITAVEFKLNGHRCYIELTNEDEDKDFQTDDMGNHCNLATNAYWAIMTLEQAGKITDVDTYWFKRYYPDESEYEA